MRTKLRVIPAKGAQRNARQPWRSTKAQNIHLKGAPSEADYRAVRDARDATLPLPRLMLAALQVTIRGGRLPEPEANGQSYLKLPLGYFEAR